MACGLDFGGRLLQLKLILDGCSVALSALKNSTCCLTITGGSSGTGQGSQLGQSSTPSRKGSTSLKSHPAFGWRYVRTTTSVFSNFQSSGLSWINTLPQIQNSWIKGVVVVDDVIGIQFIFDLLFNSFGFVYDSFLFVRSFIWSIDLSLLHLVISSLTLFAHQLDKTTVTSRGQSFRRDICWILCCALLFNCVMG